jgi:hypothetical protein
MPGYGIKPAEQGKGLLPWTWAVSRLEGARKYWLATTRPSGAPHVMPVWGIWMNDLFYFSTGATSRKAKNIAENPRCALIPEVPDSTTVVVEGIVEIISDPKELTPFAAQYKTKYDWEVDITTGPYFRIRPIRAIGMDEKNEQFTVTATRWQFERP